ncbi:MAG: hypothetical protein ACOYIG_09960 [Acetivibrionales bacterium]|jgi:hypothetical protein
MNTTTLNKAEEKSFTIKDLKKMSDIIYRNEEKQLKSYVSWFTKIMNKFGWHRKYEVIVIDKSKFNIYPQLNKR